MDKPNYYAVIPADVLWDEELTDKAKLLYGQITTLTQATGECWATNQYFAETNKVSDRTIRGLIKSLEDKGYITRKIIYNEETKEVEKRVLSLGKEFPEGMENNFHRVRKNTSSKNNTRKNNTSSNKEINKEKSVYGTYNNVFLTNQDLEILKVEFPTDWQERINNLSEYCESTGKKYKNHLVTIRNWAKRDKKKDSSPHYEEDLPWL